jgi:hypothetical protein
VRFLRVNNGPAHCRHDHRADPQGLKALHYGDLDGVGGQKVTARNSQSSAKMAATPMASAIRSVRIVALLKLGFQVLESFVWRAAVADGVKRRVKVCLHGKPVALAGAGRVEAQDDAALHSAALI